VPPIDDSAVRCGKEITKRGEGKYARHALDQHSIECAAAVGEVKVVGERSVVDSAGSGVKLPLLVIVAVSVPPEEIVASRAARIGCDRQLSRTTRPGDSIISTRLIEGAAPRGSDDLRHGR